jgi:hypothetical protein
LDIKNDKNTIYKKQSAGDAPVDDIEGVALWYLNHAPYEADMRTSFGYKADYNGVGVYVFKHMQKWRILSIFNQGLAGLTVDVAVTSLSKYPNSGLTFVSCL